MDKKAALQALSALAHEVRLDLVRLLVRTGPEGLAQGDMARRLNISASGLAFHLNHLEQAGLVIPRRAARNVLYSANLPTVGALLGYVLNDCCQAHPEVEACCRCDLTEAAESITSGEA